MGGSPLAWQSVYAKIISQTLPWAPYKPSRESLYIPQEKINDCQTTDCTGLVGLCLLEGPKIVFMSTQVWLTCMLQIGLQQSFNLFLEEYLSPFHIAL